MSPESAAGRSGIACIPRAPLILCDWTLGSVHARDAGSTATVTRGDNQRGKNMMRVLNGAAARLLPAPGSGHVRRPQRTRKH